MKREELIEMIYLIKKFYKEEAEDPITDEVEYLMAEAAINIKIKEKQ